MTRKFTYTGNSLSGIGYAILCAIDELTERKAEHVDLSKLTFQLDGITYGFTVTNLGDFNYEINTFVA